MHLSPDSGRRRIAALAMSCLADRDQFAEVWLDHTRAADGYADGIVSAEDLQETAFGVLELLLRSIAGVDLPPDAENVSGQIGRRRAAQGVPLDSLLAAARMDAQVVWNALLSRATPEDFSELLESAPLVWEVVERHTLRIMEAYQGTLLEQWRKTEDERRAVFDQLIQTGGRHPATILQAARLLALDPQGEFTVVMSGPAGANELRRVKERLTRRGLPCHTQEVVSGQVLVAQMPERPSLDLAGWLVGVRCGVAPGVEGLAQVPDAVRFATATLRAIPLNQFRPRLLTDAWLPILVAQAPDVARRLVEGILDPVRALPAIESRRLIEAVRAYCYGDGSVANTAAALYCHRNTLLNRLSRFRDLIGRDVRSPADAAVVLLALEACEQLAAESSPGTARVSERDTPARRGPRLHGSVRAASHPIGSP